MEKYSILDFTNEELVEIAKEYISTKLKREFFIDEYEGKRKLGHQIAEIDIKIKDLKNREYEFIFCFSSFAFDCVAVKHLNDSSNNNLEAMEILLRNYVNKFDVEYLENFKKYLDVYNNYDILEINNKTDLKSNINLYTTLMYCNFMFSEAAYTKFEKYSFNNSFYNKIIKTDIKYNEVTVKTLDDNDNVVNLQFCIRYLPYFIFINVEKVSLK